ncbi:MAG TPA: sigma-70 family RNA polymerase sigma factor [Chitinophagaceae bacterium]|jgi:RNA polymerase sigma-70 factor (ECF subfamily)|nr:sigma-70 family RNA polymerase sigma factor [Chitinophagaceae bacterium]
MLITKQFEATTETEIIKRIKEGEIDLFEILVRRNNPFLYKIGMSYGYSHQNVEDLMQEAFIAAYLNLNKFEQRSSFKTWITKIMLNQCYHKAQRMSFKKEKTASTNSEKTISDFENLQSVDGFKKIISRELSHVIEDAIIHMPLDYRMVLSLRELNGMSTAETAEVLDISEENVKVRLNRAKQLLKQRLEKIYEPKEIFEFNLVYCDAIVYRVMKAITARS